MHQHKDNWFTTTERPKMMLTKYKIIAIFCFTDDLLKRLVITMTATNI